MKIQNLDDLEWIGVRFFDTNVRTFYYEGAYYKAVLPTAHEFILNEDFDDVLKELYSEGFIPETVRTELVLDGFVRVYKQYTEYFNISIANTGPSTIKEAAMLYIKMNLWLYDKGFLLCDGHIGNMVIQKNDKPFWCDIGSITPLSTTNEFQGIDEFFNSFIYPLLLRARGASLGNAMRWFCSGNMNKKIAKDLSFGCMTRIIKKIVFFNFRMLNRLSRSRLFSKLPFSSRILSIFRKFASRKALLHCVEKIIKRIDFSWEKTTWSDYTLGVKRDDPIAVHNQEHNRPRMIHEIIQSYKPDTVIDLGANSGFFSRIAASAGAQVLAIELDERAVDKGHFYLQKYGSCKPIKFAVANVAVNFQQADMVLALALSHHLYLTTRFPWHHIIKIFAGHTKKHLVTEFMPNGLGVNKKQENLPDDYTLENFVKELQMLFEKVEVLEYKQPPHFSPRIPILCTNKKILIKKI